MVALLAFYALFRSGTRRVAPWHAWQAHGVVLAAGVLAVSGTPVVSQEQAAEAQASALIDQTTLSDAIDQKGARPQADPSVLPPAANELPAGLQPLAAPPTLKCAAKDTSLR